MSDFPDCQAAQGWYDSPEYREILPLRTGNSVGVAVLAEHCGDDHVATDVLS
ncbi:DUF1330 domain-containing protein [Nocardia sp. NPDC060256]|uniref:DUF1330 domain-containing protein n=1 Tax=unclassified Nocardia TaxID=2637762 RepID=UPI00364A2567